MAGQIQRYHPVIEAQAAEYIAPGVNGLGDAVNENKRLAVAFLNVVQTDTLIEGAFGLPFIIILIIVIVVIVLGQGGQAHFLPFLPVKFRFDVVVIVIVPAAPGLLCLFGLGGLLFLLCGSLFRGLHGQLYIHELTDILGIDKLLYLKHYAHLYILLSPRNSIRDGICHR